MIRLFAIALLLLPLSAHAQGVHAVLSGSGVPASGCTGACGDPIEPDYASLDAALAAVTTGDVGSTVTVGGLRGGTFTVTSSGAAPDDGTIFVPDDALGTPVSGESFPIDASGIEVAFSGAPFDHGSFALRVTASGPDNTLDTLLLAEHLHGNAWSSSRTQLPALDPATGFFREPRSGSSILRTVIDGWTGATDSGTLALEAATPITGTLRLERVWTDTVRAEWFGCRTHADEAYFDNTGCLNWMGVAVRGMNEASPGSVAAITLPETLAPRDTLWYRGTITLPLDVEIVGKGGAVREDTTITVGGEEVTYPHLVLADEATVLKVFPNDSALRASGECPECVGGSYYAYAVDVGSKAPGPKELLASGHVMIQFDEGPGGDIIVTDLWLDGSGEEDAEMDVSQDYFRNNPRWSGFGIQNQNGYNVVDQRGRFTRVGVDDYPATGIITSTDADTTFFHDVLLGKSARNHSLYGLSPIVATGLLNFTGYSWNNAWYDGPIDSLIVDRLVENPFGGACGQSACDDAVFSIRGRDTDTCEQAVLDGWRDACGTFVDYTFVDNRAPDGSIRPHRYLISGGTGPDWQVSNATAVGSFGTASIRGNGNESARYHGHAFGPVRLHIIGNPAGDRPIAPSQVTQRAVYRDYEVVSDDDESDDFVYVTALRVSGRESTAASAFGSPYEMVLDSIGYRDGLPIHVLFPFGGLAIDDGVSPQYASRIYLVNSHIRASNSTYLRGSSGGRIDNFCETMEPCALLDSVQVYIKDTDLVGSACSGSNCTAFMAVARFEGVTNGSGLTSEAEATYTCTGGETSGYVQPGILWAPHAERGQTTLSGDLAGSVSASEWQASDGSALSGTNGYDPRFSFTLSSACSAGETLTVEAAVSRWLDEDGDPVALPGWYAE